MPIHHFIDIYIRTASRKLNSFCVFFQTEFVNHILFNVNLRTHGEKQESEAKQTRGSKQKVAFLKMKKGKLAEKFLEINFEIGLLSQMALEMKFHYFSVIDVSLSRLLINFVMMDFIQICCLKKRLLEHISCFKKFRGAKLTTEIFVQLSYNALEEVWNVSQITFLSLIMKQIRGCDFRKHVYSKFTRNCYF